MRRAKRKGGRPKNTGREASIHIMEFHHDRLVKYAEKREMSLDKAVDEIIFKHRRGVNVAQFMSDVLEVSHQKYRETLLSLGEHSDYVR